MSFDAFDISASALHAQRIRMDTIASNLANINTTRKADGTPGPYVRKQAIFQAVYDQAMGQPEMTNSGITGPSFSAPGFSGFNSTGSNMLLKGSVSFDAPSVASGVTVSQISEDANQPFKRVYDPSHPDADKDGFVNMPNINMVTEMVDMMSASRAYEANVTAIDATKNMIAAAARI